MTVTVAFLTGATLLLLAASTQTAVVAAQFDDPGRASYVTGVPDRAPPGETHLPVATAESNRSDATVTVVGIPATATTEHARHLQTPPGTITVGESSTVRTEQFVGSAETVTASVRPRSTSGSLVPSRWYVSDAATARTLGAGATIRISNASVTEQATGVPLVGALVFFVRGTREAVTALGATAAGVALLVGTTVFSVARMSVRDRTTTIRVARATGARPGTIRRLFALRAGLLTGVGVTLGYAVGVIVAHASATIAVGIGVPTSLSVGVTPGALRLLGPLYGGLAVIGLGAGWLAARPVAGVPPGRVGGRRDTPTECRLPTWAQPQLLSWRVLVPTTATLTAFAAVVVLLAGLAGAAGPVVAGDETTVTEPGSRHPVASQVPAVYATVLRDRGLAASGEILLFQVSDGQPFLARGADYRAFAAVSDAQLQRGRPHRQPGEVVIGADLARTLDVDVGDTLSLGGSTRPAFTRVQIVGVYTAPGATDDQLLVGLPTARQLAGVRAGAVQFIRTDRLPRTTASDAASSVAVTGLSSNATVANTTVQATVTVQNLGVRETTANVTVAYRNHTQTRPVTLPASASTQLTVEFDAGPPGTYRLQAGTQREAVTVRPRDALVLTGVPDRLPVASEPRVRLTDATGTPVADAQVKVGNQTRQTDEQGFVRLPPVAAGTYSVRATAGDRVTTAPITVSASQRRQPTVEIAVSPTTPSVLDRPTVRVRLANPWNRTLTRAVGITAADPTTRRVRLAPGTTRTLTERLSRQSPGSYTVRAELNGTTAASRQYEVTGDDRVVAALASSGQTGSSGLEQAIGVAFGNLQVVIGALVTLAVLMTVGATTAVFTQAVHARRRTLGIYRATGAGPGRLATLVVRDAVLLGAIATPLAAGLATVGLSLLAAGGYLTVFGVRLSTTLSLSGTVALVAGGLAVTVLGTGLAVAGTLSVAPGALLTDAEPPPGTTDTEGGIDD